MVKEFRNKSPCMRSVMMRGQPTFAAAVVEGAFQDSWFGALKFGVRSSSNAIVVLFSAASPPSSLFLGFAFHVLSVLGSFTQVH